MNKVNFHHLQSISPPQQWVDTALAIPHNSAAPARPERKRPVPRAAARVAIAAVCVIGISLFLIIRPINRQAITPAPSDRTAYIAQRTEADTREDPTVSAITPTAGETSAAQAVSEGATDHTSPTDGQPRAAEPNAPDQPSGAAPGISTPPTSSPAMPTHSATSPAAVAPTIAPAAPTDTTINNSGDAQGGESNETSAPVACTAVVSADLLTGHRRVYCRLYNSSGQAVGDSLYFSSQHRTERKPLSDGTVSITYYPTATGLTLQPGQYRYVMYNEDIVDIAEGYLNI